MAKKEKEVKKDEEHENSSAIPDELNSGPLAKFDK